MKLFESVLIVFGIFYLHEVVAQTGQYAEQIQRTAAQDQQSVAQNSLVQNAARFQRTAAQDQQSAAQISLGQNAAHFQQTAAQDQQSAAQIPLGPNAAQTRQSPVQFGHIITQLGQSQVPKELRPVQILRGQIRQPLAQLLKQQPRQTGAQLPIQQIRQGGAQFPTQQSWLTGARFPIQQSRQTSAQFPIQQSRQISAQFPIQQSRQTSVQFPIQQSRQTSAQFPIQQSRQTSAQFPIQQGRQTSAQFPIQQSRQTSAQFPIQQGRQTSAQFPIGQISQRGAPIVVQAGIQGSLGPYRPPLGLSRQSKIGGRRLSSSDCQVRSVDISSEAQSLSTEAKTVGLSIASKLDSFMRDKSVTDSGVAPVYNQNLDFLFILDSSGSIGACEFLAAKNASKVVAEYINERNPISSTGSRVGLIEFSSPAWTHVIFGFGDRESLAAVTDAIDSITYDSGLTSTAIALKLAQTEFEQNGKADHTKVAWVLTDGRSNTGGDPIPVARQLKNMGITVCAVAIGSGVNMAEINGIATENCVFQLPSFSTYRKANVYAFTQQFGDKSSSQQQGKF